MTQQFHSSGWTKETGKLLFTQDSDVNVLNSFAHNSLTLNASQIPINKQMITNRGIFIWYQRFGNKKKRSSGDFPGGPVVKNPPSNAGDAGSIPGRGTKIPHAAGQLSPHATTTEPQCMCFRAHTPLERSPHAATKTRRSQINK